ncbi:MAG: methyl-accepting chemotaxis protein [Holophaga sp.]|jgi:chemotaxis regulatin CheY-phosphate phosphatase CheZ
MEPEASVSTLASGQQEDLQPETLLKEFRERSEALDHRLDTLQELIELIRGELRDSSSHSLSRLAKVAEDMANGRVFQQIDIQAKGELGALVTSLNATLQNLQQLDTSVKQQSTQVPELAAQLDAITADTETATQNVMNRLDTLMAASDAASTSVKNAVMALMETREAQAAFQGQLDAFLTRAGEGADPLQLAQEILEFLFAHQIAPPPPPAGLDQCLAPLATISDEAFEILNTLQFQDITRQKVEKVVLLLKQFKEGLNRLLDIFHIEGLEGRPADPVFAQRPTATQDKIFEATLEADSRKESVDDIIAQFKNAQN